uniref:Glycine--tRNA ligase 1, mitochondrial n=1 Tax=Anthurium amnicola TaxID=1678845 RepID=A0A1D1YS65_9ARAE
MAAAVSRALASTSSSPTTARHSVAFLLSRRLYVGSSTVSPPFARFARLRPFPSAASLTDILHDMAGLGNSRLNQTRCMVHLSGDSALETNKRNGDHTEVVKEWYGKMLKSVEAETMPPNAWLWSLIENCSNQEDIKLLFQILQNLRRFRLANLRIHANFNCHLCLKVTEACARVGALHYGKKALWKHNIYGLTPSIGSAHYLLLYAKEHKDPKLMVHIMKLLRRNSLPLQPGTADIVFSICCISDRWDLISKYSKIFIKAGVKLRRAAFDVWMDFAAKKGDAQSLWEIEKLRSIAVGQHTVSSAFSCAKGFLLEHNPEGAAAVIHVLNENLPNHKMPGIAHELQKLVSEWPLEVMKWQKRENKKVLAISLKNDIPKMVSSLLNMGLEVAVNMDELKC